MSPLLNTETDGDVNAFIESIDNPSKIADAKILLAMMTKITGEEPKIWGKNSLIGFGKFKYKRKGGKEEFEWFNVGFAPRKTKITVYVSYDLTQEEEMLGRLGKHKTGKGCLYINKLKDIDLDVLHEVISKSKDSEFSIQK